MAKHLEGMTAVNPPLKGWYVGDEDAEAQPVMIVAQISRVALTIDKHLGSERARGRDPLRWDTLLLCLPINDGAPAWLSVFDVHLDEDAADRVAFARRVQVAEMTPAEHGLADDRHPPQPERTQDDE